jgi:hypothetical protein
MLSASASDKRGRKQQGVGPVAAAQRQSDSRTRQREEEHAVSSQGHSLEQAHEGFPCLTVEPAIEAGIPTDERIVRRVVLGQISEREKACAQRCQRRCGSPPVSLVPPGMEERQTLSDLPEGRRRPPQHRHELGQALPQIRARMPRDATHRLTLRPARRRRESHTPESRISHRLMRLARAAAPCGAAADLRT